jgi:DNA-directed RNA polymerase II subunit RPB7
MLLKKDVVIFPKDFGPNMQQRLIDKLIEKVEGSCSGRYGFVICVTEVVTLGKGKIREGGRLRPCRYCCCCARALARHLLWVPATFAGAGVVMFQMSFNAIVFRPFKGEALDAIVKSVNKMGFFAEVGPLDVFVSKHLIPADMSFDPQSNPAAYISQISEEQPLRITKGSEVRLRVIGTRMDAAEIFAIGSIKEDFLGVIGPG